MDISPSRTDRQTMDFPDGTSDEGNEALDPRIQSELDHLNVASTEINRLENELDEARSKYRSIISETSNRMEVILHDRKRSIQKSREYYKLIGEAKIAQAEAFKAARQFQTATTVYKAAKETVALAECRLIEEAQTTTAAQLTSAWQEMLNHAISKVTVAERDKTNSEQEHKKRAAKFAELESKIQVLEKKFSKSIKKSRPYFELKAELDIKLMQQKQNVNDLQAAIKSNKRKYTETLKRLERISEEIHQSRHERFWSKIPRMPGVGAETDSVASSLSEMGKESLGYESDLESQFDTVSMDKQDLDLQLNLELGGMSVRPENDKTPIGEAGPDEVFEEGVSGENLDQKNNNDQPDKKEMARVSSERSDNTTSQYFKFEQSDTKENTEDGLEQPGSSRHGDRNGANKHSYDTQEADSNAKDALHVNSVSDKTGSTEQVLQDKHADESDELTESFESFDEASSPVEVDIVEPKKLTNGAMKSVENVKDYHKEPGAVYQDKGNDSTNMARVERPSLSGAED